MKIGHKPTPMSVERAQDMLEKNVRLFCKEYRKWPYRTKLPYLQECLINLKIARRAAV